MGTERWRNDTDRGKRNYPAKNLLTYHSLLQRYRLDWFNSWLNAAVITDMKNSKILFRPSEKSFKKIEIFRNIFLYKYILTFKFVENILIYIT
jgi:hypothetical protein